MPRTLPMTLERLFERSIPEPNSGCWIWLGARNHKGYGNVRANGSQKRAHRVAYELARGPIAAGLLVCHRCDVPCCINPDHLFLGTDEDNFADSVRKGRRPTMSFGAFCKYGHLRERPGHCRLCRNRYNRNWYARRPTRPDSVSTRVMVR